MNNVLVNSMHGGQIVDHDAHRPREEQSHAPPATSTQLQLQNVLCALLRQTIDLRCQRHRQEHATGRRRYLEHVELDRQHLAQQPQHSSQQGEARRSK